MKFKFRGEPKDWLYFLLFAIFLLYLVAIGILNLASLSQRQELYGLLPFEAFSPKFLLSTIVFYVFALIGIIIAAASYFWEREKGFGFELGKSSKDGYSRWAKDEEIKKGLKEINITEKEIKHGGMPLFVDVKKNKVWVDDGEAHTLIMGSTGSGKTRRLILPLIKILAKKGESMILTDPKGELYEESASLLMEKGYKIVILNLRNPEKGNAWNPLTLPYMLYKEGSDKSKELLADLGRSLLHDEKSDDPFWQNSSSDYFTGLALGMFEDAQEEEINLNSISFMSAVGEEKIGGTVYAKEYFSTKDPSKATYINASGTINAPQDTKNSILSVFRQKIKIFATTEHLAEMLSYSDFSMADIGKQKTAVFIIIQDEKKTYHALATVFVKQCYETLIDVAQDNNGKLPIRTNFILDEFANMPPLTDVTTMITAARSRQIRFNLVIQNFAQLSQVYGKDDAETIKGNSANLVYLMSKELQALEEISKLCGDKKVKNKDGKEESKPLINISELQRLKPGDGIVIKDRSFPLKIKLPGDWEYNYNESKATQVNYPIRQRKPIQLFDIRNYVQQKRAERVNNSNIFGAPIPFGQPISKNDFLPKSDVIISPPMNQMSKGQPRFNDDDMFDVDEFIKKIDAKIAELEAEEKNGKETNVLDEVKPTVELEKPIIVEEKEIIKPDVIVEPIDNNQNIVTPNLEANTKEEEIVKINPDLDKIINIDEDETTDDQFFDDFFSEE